jgi:hypothetical protein
VDSGALHYLALIEEKPGALDQAAVRRGWELPPTFAEMRRLLETRMGPRGKREYVQVLRLMEIAPMPVVSAAAAEAIRRGVIGFDAVKQLVVARMVLAELADRVRSVVLSALVPAEVVWS